MMLPLTIGGTLFDDNAYIRADEVRAVYCEHEKHLRNGETVRPIIIEMRNGSVFETSLSKAEVLRLMAVERVTKDAVYSCVASLQNAQMTLADFRGLTRSPGQFPVQQAFDNINVAIKVLRDLVTAPG